MYLFAYVHISITSKVDFASPVLSGRSRYKGGGRGTTFCEELRASLGGSPGSSRTVISPPTFSSWWSAFPSPSSFFTGDCDWLLRDLTADADAESSSAMVVVIVGWVPLEGGSSFSSCLTAPLPLVTGDGPSPSCSSFMAVTASATDSDWRSALSWDMTTRTVCAVFEQGGSRKNEGERRSLDMEKGDRRKKTEREKKGGG